MSTATATQDDDLIILSDNISSTFGDDPIISQDLNFTDNNSVISFDTPSDNSTISPIVGNQTINDMSIFGENIIKQEDSLTRGIVENIETKNETLISQEPQQVPEETKELDSSINNLFGDINFSNQTTNTESEVNNGTIVSNELEIKSDEPVGDMNSILNMTIDKLKKRQTGISGQKSSKITTINELETKIKELRDQVAYLKKEIVFLDEENIKIDINVGNLESMKIGKQTKVASKTREHNTKKLTKQIKPV